MKTKKNIIISILCLLLCFIGILIYKKNQNIDYIYSLEQLNNEKYIIASPVNSKTMDIVEKRFPKSKKQHITNEIEGFKLLRKGKVDGYANDYIALKYIEKINPLFKVINQELDSSENAVGINPKRKDLTPKINNFISKYQNDKTARNMYLRWFVLFQDKMPSIAKSKNPKETLKIGINSTIKPYSFYGRDKKLKGYNIEFLQRLANDLDVDYELYDLPFNELVSNLKEDKLDIAVANLNDTEERRKLIDFSNPYLIDKTGILVLKKRIKNIDKDNKTSITKISELEGKKIGITTGSSVFENAMKKNIKGAKAVFYDSIPDEFIALSQSKVDALILDKPVARYASNTYKGVKCLEPALTIENYGIIFSKKNENLRNNFNTILKELKEDGTIEKIDRKWFGSDENQKILPEKLGETNNPIGELNLATCSAVAPFVYIKDNHYVGYEIEIIHLIAKKLGYSLNIHDMNFASIIPSIVSGKDDMGAMSISITEERKKTVLFSEPDYQGGLIVVVKDDNNIEQETFISQTKESFKRTFLDEDRYKLILDGLKVTILITIFSILFGTVLAMLVCILRRSNKKILNIPAKIFITLVQGTPVLVMLLIMYYIIFANISINPVIVAIIAFAINFSAYAAEMFRTGLDAIDKGQIEAAQSFGFNKIQTFSLIIVPQALKHILPVYRGLAIDMLKTTSIVGYIAIQDLTKMSDIIRSRTYDAFFPIISTAIIYFIFAYILTELLKHCELKLNPKYKKRIIKGVKNNANN